MDQGRLKIKLGTKMKLCPKCRHQKCNFALFLLVNRVCRPNGFQKKITKSNLSYHLTHMDRLNLNSNYGSNDRTYNKTVNSFLFENLIFCFYPIGPIYLVVW